MGSRLRENLEQIEARMAAACARAGRRRADVTLVGVTKTAAPELAAQLHALGVTHLGESRPQELWRKAELLPPTVHWHLIGHLQRNKIERTTPLARWVHAVDSLRLLEALEQDAERRGAGPKVLLEVNASGEASKLGFAPADLPQLVPALRRLRFAQPLGLMTMAALQEPELCRPTFALLRRLRDELAEQLGRPLPELSMGMSNDFEVAIEEGATFVRLGTILFEGVDD